MTREQAKMWATIPRDKLAVIAPGLDKHFDILLAYANGAEVQYKLKDEENWKESTPLFEEYLEYRVKPSKAEATKPKGQWKPEHRETYFFLPDLISVKKEIFEPQYESDRKNIEIGNFFRTEKEALAALKRVQDALKGKVNEHEFDYKGKTYIAVEDKDECNCSKCAFCQSEDCMKLRTQWKIPPCYKEKREDCKNVIFVEKGKTK